MRTGSERVSDHWATDSLATCAQNIQYWYIFWFNYLLLIFETVSTFSTLLFQNKMEFILNNEV